MWCRHVCRVVRQPGDAALDIGRPRDWLGLYDPALVQKFVFTRPQRSQVLLTSGDFRNSTRYRGQNLYRLHAVPFNLAEIMRN